MKEDQHIEFKESWHDEYTRYVSAFCNTEGGVLYIGLNDNGTVVGIEHPENRNYASCLFRNTNPYL